MLVTVLWEDQRAVGQKGFGPHELLLSAMADDLAGTPEHYQRKRRALAERVIAVPKKGNGNVRRALEKDLPRLHGPVIAVIDRDKALELCSGAMPRPSNCMQGISNYLRTCAPGTYELVFLIDNTESLIAACAGPSLVSKPSPDERDRILARAAWGPPADRHALRRTCPSFDRLVHKACDLANDP